MDNFSRRLPFQKIDNFLKQYKRRNNIAHDGKFLSLLSETRDLSASSDDDGGWFSSYVESPELYEYYKKNESGFERQS